MNSILTSLLKVKVSTSVSSPFCLSVSLSSREAKLCFLLHRCFVMFRLALGWLVEFRCGIVGWSLATWKKTADFSTFASDIADLLRALKYAGFSSGFYLVCPLSEGVKSY